jgi:hypothetical protein
MTSTTRFVKRTLVSNDPDAIAGDLKDNFRCSESGFVLRKSSGFLDDYIPRWLPHRSL